jgi:hypothetical protein
LIVAKKASVCPLILQCEQVYYHFSDFTNSVSAWTGNAYRNFTAIQSF